MNILVTGANGQLGNEMRLLSPRSKNNYYFTDVAELDITNTLVSTTASATAYLGAQQNEGTITVTMTSTQSDIFNAAFAADEKNVGVVIDVLP